MTKRSNRSKNIGSVSHATMRAEDLIPCFVSELESQRPLQRQHRKLVREIKRRMAQDYIANNESDYDGACGDGWSSDDAQYDLEALFDALNEYCLPYFYFGAHPGDGSDYGYWLSEDFAEEFADASTNFAKADGAQLPENIKVNDLADVPKGFTGEVLQVNDHGNCSLYAYAHGRGREVWAVV